MVKLDTIYEPLYLLHVQNNLYVNPSEEGQKGTLEGLILSMQINYDLQVLPEDSSILSLPTKIDYSMLKDMPLDEFKRVLKRNGLELIVAKDRKARIITYSGM